MQTLFRAAVRAAIAVGLFAGFASQTTAQATTLTFEGVSATYPFAEPIPVLNFYNGGTSASGTSGTNYGVSFSSNAAAVCLNTIGTACNFVSRGGVGDPASAFTGLFLQEGDMAVMNRPDGMINEISFNYVSRFEGTFWVWDGLNGTGNLLGFVDLTDNAVGCSEEYFFAFFCPFEPMTVSFSGIARSAVFTGVTDAAAVDDITFQAQVVPEPSTIVLLSLGLAAVGVVARRRYC
ncbi:MAG: PEP-CTERM sorting domain-containing protein [Gemmatimonas sp.]